MVQLFITCSHAPPRLNRFYNRDATGRTPPAAPCGRLDSPLARSCLRPRPCALRASYSEPRDGFVLDDLAGLTEPERRIEVACDGVRRQIRQHDLAALGLRTESLYQRGQGRPSVATPLESLVDLEPADPVATVVGVARPHDEADELPVGADRDRLPVHLEQAPHEVPGDLADVVALVWRHPELEERASVLGGHVVQRHGAVRAEHRWPGFAQADVPDVVAPVTVQEEVPRRSRPWLEPERADQPDRRDVLRPDVGLEPVEIQVLERIADDELESLSEIALARERRERVVAEEPALERAAHDRRDVRDPRDRVIGRTRDQEARLIRPPRPPDVGLERLGRVGRLDPRPVQTPRPASGGHERHRVVSAGMPDPGVVASRERAGHRGAPARAKASSITRSAAARFSNPSVLTACPSRSL